MSQTTNKYIYLLSTVFSVCLVIAPTPYSFVIAAETGGDVNKEAKDSGKQQKQKIQKIVYRPPSRGAPATRIGGGTRGEGVSGSKLYVLTPNHTGLTTKQQPTLYWYVSEPVNVYFEFALIEDTGLKTVFETQLNTANKAGIQKVSLSDHAVKLKADTEYQWFVALIDDIDQRSKDIVASGMIKYIKPVAEISDVSGEKQAVELAAKGYWYDALAILSEMISQQPDDSNIRTLRAELLEQADLKEVANFDRKLTGLAH